MPNLAIIGGQWGDEGKGKVVDRLARRFDVVARFQGGPNAGHTVVFEGNQFALHHVPSGIFHHGVISMIGAGTLIDPERLIGELDGLRGHGVPVDERLRISRRAHVILPLFRNLDEAMEERLGDAAIGTTKRGIGPTAAAKALRLGLRMEDLACVDRVKHCVGRLLDSGYNAWMSALGRVASPPEEVARHAVAWWRALGPLCADVSTELLDALDAGRSVLFEGAQGVLLDLDHGTYPFVTSSSTTTGGIAPGLGVPPRAIDRSVGVFKAYSTRVGAGPFPTQDDGPLGDRLRQIGREFGTTTGRPRRCGWFDAVAARHAARLSGFDGMAVTKFDVLTGIDPVRVCVAYDVDGQRTTSMPTSIEALQRAVPVYEDCEGWTQAIHDARTLERLPRAARVLLDRLAELCRCEIALVSVGPDRTQTIEMPGGPLAAFASARPDEEAR